MDELWEEWECPDCGYIDIGPVDGFVGKNITLDVGKGRYKRKVETVVCPNCESKDWHSEATDRINPLEE